MTIAARLSARASLHASPGTPVTADEVAYVLDTPPDVVRMWAPGVEVMPWSAWLLAWAGELHEQPEAYRPVTSWREVAAILRVSHDTVARRRGPDAAKGRPWFGSADDVREWWRALITPAPPPAPAPTPRSRKPKAGTGKVFDTKALRAKLLGR
jgi:hypothetical protein